MTEERIQRNTNSARCWVVVSDDPVTFTRVPIAVYDSPSEARRFVEASGGGEIIQSTFCKTGVDQGGGKEAPNTGTVGTSERPLPASQVAPAPASIRQRLDTLLEDIAMEYVGEDSLVKISHFGIEAIVERAYRAGVEAKADEIMERWQDEVVPRPRRMITSYESTILALADSSHSDDWCYDPRQLESDSGVILMARMYNLPTLQVARDLAECRRRMLQEFLTNRRVPEFDRPVVPQPKSS